MLLTIIVFFVILGTLVLVHELGHFLVAKRNGVPSEEFGFGFPPRIVGTYKDKKGKRKWIWGNKQIEKEALDREETVYSLNWIPLGGFVKIVGEDGQDRTNPKSFAAAKIWTRFKILVAGVSMNFILGIFLFAGAFWLGLPEAIDDNATGKDIKVQISVVSPDSPAQKANIKTGDQVVSFIESDKETPINNVAQLQDVVEKNKGEEIGIKVIHPGETKPVVLQITPRKNPPEGSGPLGVQIVRTAFVRYDILTSVWLGIKTSFFIIGAIFAFLGDLIVKLFTAEPLAAEVAGPIGIAVMTGQVTKMGLAFILQFAALLSINLAVINLLPLPALDGGRILFLLIEKIKGSPVSQKVEGIVHTAGFIFLLGLMFFVTLRDFANFEIIEKVKNIF